MAKIIANILPLKPGVSSETVVKISILCIIVVASILRILAYGNPNLSIATNDTPSYIKSSQVPLLSSEILTGRRLLSTNLVYKIFEPKGGYKILVNGSIDTTRRIFQPGFDRIVIFQLILSIMGWGFLAFVLSEYIRNTLMKVLGSVTVIAFAFTPQIADWDSILMSESLVYSLFALQLAALIKISFLIYTEKPGGVSFYLTIWAFTFFGWTFLRDTNLFASLATIGLFTILFLFTKFRENKKLHGIFIFIIIIFIIGLTTSSNSTRSVVQMVNVYRDDLLLSPARVSTLQELGMPTPGSEEFESWFQENSSKTLVKFMFIHPGYPVLKIIKDFPPAFTEIKQTYFKAPEQFRMREPLMTIGNALHPENVTPFLLDLFLLFGITILAYKNINERSRPWAWIAFWLLMTASLTLVPTILGDTWALNRHALFSTMIYRLFMWVFLIIIMDIAIDQNPKQRQPTVHSQIQQT